MGIVATIEFGSKEGKERILFNITKAFKAIILWIVRILYSLKYFLVCPGTILIIIIYESWYDCTQALLLFTEYYLNVGFAAKAPY